MGVIVGIDLGTTNSAVALLGPDGPRLLPNALGDVLTPSVVGLAPDGKLLVGRAARELQVSYPDRCVALFKRHMGSDWRVTLAGQVYAPEQLSSLVLRTLKADAEAALGTPIERAVITVPAYFHEHQRKATIQAGEWAGLKVERIFNEPTAAAVAYGLHEGKQQKIIGVLDLGGGTFDVSIVEFCDGVLEVRASSGENFLGGEDFTRLMAARILTERGLAFERAEMQHPLLVSRLIQQCEVAKRLLTKQDRATVRIPATDGNLADDAATFEVTRTQFEAWTQAILQRIEMPIHRALGDASLTPANIDEVILVGGATRMPMFINRVRHIFQREPHCRLNPDEVVALGASVQAGLIGQNAAVDDMVVTDVAPFTLGVETTREFGQEMRDGYFLPVINRNTTIPVSRVRRVTTLHPNQTLVKIRVFQGESRRVTDNLLLGEFEVHNIPRGPAGQEVDIRFSYDLNGVLEVEATVVATKQKVTHLITRYAKSLSTDQLQQALVAMQALKTHPRDEAANHFTLVRAERLYKELPLVERTHLEMLLSGFEQALELGEKELIAEHRAAVQEYLDQWDNERQDLPGDDDHDA